MSAVPSPLPELEQRSGGVSLSGAVVKGFGSFHTESVEVLIAQSDDEYRPPPVPIKLPSLRDYMPEHTSANANATASDAESASASSLLKSGLFLLDPEWTFINHGAFGAALRPAVDAAERWHRYMVRRR
jgi:hypothetical protein